MISALSLGRRGPLDPRELPIAGIDRVVLVETEPLAGHASAGGVDEQLESPMVGRSPVVQTKGAAGVHPVLAPEGVGHVGPGLSLLAEALGKSELLLSDAADLPRHRL